MRKIIPIVMLLALLLSGCDLADQARTVNEKYIAPAAEAAADQSDDTETETAAGPDVATDSSALTEYTAPETVRSRLSSEPLTELVPSDNYGTLLPYVGAYYYQDDGDRLDKYGLATESGTIVLDPVLTSLDLASCSSGGQTVWFGIYIMGRTVEGDDGDGRTMYALAGKDGGWVTGFDYTQVIPMALGVLCVRDSDTNNAVCYAEDGSIVFDTINFSELWRLEPNSITSLADCSEGYMRICYSNGQYGFISADGSILNRYVDRPSYLDDTRAFSEGLAAVELYDQWNYIDTAGYYAIYGLFDEAGDFHNGVAVVKQDGVYEAINTENTVLKEFPDAETALSYDNYIYVKNTDGTEHYYLTPSMTEANIYDKQIYMCADGYWVVGADGVRMRTFGGQEIYFSGAVSLEACSGDGLYLLKLADSSFAVMDEYSRVVATAESSLGFVNDSETGETYIYKYTGNGADLYNSSGTLAADNVILRDIEAGYTGFVYGKNYGPDGGHVMCADKFTSGLKNTDNSWVLRIQVDTGD